MPTKRGTFLSSHITRQLVGGISSGPKDQNLLGWLSLLKNLSGLGIALAIEMTTDGFLISGTEYRRPYDVGYQCFGLGVPFCLSAAVVQRNHGPSRNAPACLIAKTGHAARRS